MNKNLPKIAFLLGNISTSGGIERVTSIISHELTEKKIAKVYAVGFHPKHLKSVYQWNTDVVLVDLLRKEESMKTGIFKAIPKLRSFLKKNNINILVACGHRYTPLAGLSTMASKTKMIYWSHSSFYGEIVAFKDMNEKFGAFCSSAVISLTETDKKNYLKETRAKKVVQIYNPVDKKLLVQDVAYNPDTKKIISVGRLDHPKNFESYLLEVAKIVLENNKGYTWHIFGKGGLENVIRENINKMGLAGKVIMEGNVDNLYEHYPYYSIMVMTSSYEGLPMTLIEGMAQKLPLVSFDIQTGPNEIIENEVNGYLIPPFDISLMARKLEMLIQDKNVMINMSKANKTMIEKFKIENIINQWSSLISDLSNGNSLKQ